MNDDEYWDETFKTREWLIEALRAKGGSGFDTGGADVWFTHDGREYFITLTRSHRQRNLDGGPKPSLSS